mmetsp:Transcript_87991/g.247258  ORF Transcript_87991/g.247258 Transcript_87991/m.247258 type:complete len:234 (-) Transcript_87991:13-714(-)
MPDGWPIHPEDECMPLSFENRVDAVRDVGREHHDVAQATRREARADCEAAAFVLRGACELHGNREDASLCLYARLLVDMPVVVAIGATLMPDRVVASEMHGLCLAQGLVLPQFLVSDACQGPDAFVHPAQLGKRRVCKVNLAYFGNPSRLSQRASTDAAGLCSGPHKSQDVHTLTRTESARESDAELPFPVHDPFIHGRLQREAAVATHTSLVVTAHGIRRSAAGHVATATEA